MAVCESILDAIGNTPLVRLSRAMTDLTVELYGKVEACNPGGSSKDRLAAHLVEWAEKEGALVPGALLIEASAGNTGVGLAMVAAVRGYRCTIVVPNGTSADKLAVVRAFGASIHICKPDEDYDAIATRLAAELGGYRPDQFSHPENPVAHLHTADELWTELDGRIDALVAVCGTGGTLAGIGKALRARAPRVALVRVSPTGGDGESVIEGVAPDGPPESFGCPPLTRVIAVSDADAFAAADLLARKEGLLVGASSGAAFAGAVRYARNARAGDRVVVILPDTGRNYVGSRSLPAR